jgi:hypothetical protein
VFYFPNRHPNKKTQKSAAERKRESRAKAKAKAEAEEKEKEQRDNHTPMQENPVIHTEDPATNSLISTL